MALARQAIPATVDDIIAIYNRENSAFKTRLMTRRNWDGSPSGITSMPRGTTTSKIQEKNASGKMYYTRIPIDRNIDINVLASRISASEGSNESLYLKACVVEIDKFFTNQYFKNESELYDPKTNPTGMSPRSCLEDRNGRPSVMIVVDESVSLENKRAEEEHCSDIIHAFKMTIGQMDSNPFMEPRQKPLSIPDSPFAEPIIPQKDLHGTKAAKDVLDRFEKLCKKTGHRDIRNWHHFSYKKITQDAALRIINEEGLEYDMLKAGSQRGQVSAWLQMVRGDSLAVGVYGSEYVMKTG